MVRKWDALGFFFEEEKWTGGESEKLLAFGLGRLAVRVDWRIIQYAGYIRVEGEREKIQVPCEYPYPAAQYIIEVSVFQSMNSYYCFL